MRLNSLWTAGLALCSATVLCGSARAEGAGDARARQGAHRAGNAELSVVDAPMLQERTSPTIPYFPLPAGTVFKKVSVGGDAGGAAAGGETLAYLNENGRFVNSLRANQLVADDITIRGRKGCKIRKFTFQITGRGDPSGVGGPFRVFYSLYNTCPQAGGTIIGGINGQIDFPDDGAHEVEVVVPGDVVLPRTTVWLALRFNRDNCGIVIGSPALKGFSSDRFDFPLLPCNGNIGGFPNFPHASFNARVYTDAACEDAYPGYRNVAPGEPGHSFGASIRYADDLELGVTSCDLIGYEIGVRGLASYNVDLRRDAGGFPGSQIAGTSTNFLHAGSGIQIFSYTIDPPVRLTGSPNRVWMTLRPNTATGKWIRTGRNAEIGNTSNGVAVETFAGSGIFEIMFPDPDDMLHGAYYAVLTCADQPPLGACCDMYVTDAQGDAVCRTVPEMNCPFPPRGTSLRPAWEEGSACRVCAGGCRDGLACEEDGDCAGFAAGDCFDGTCVGGCNDGEGCLNDSDCAGADNGTCVANDPFLIPCGKSACCTPQDTCVNLTRRECNAVEPVFRERQWQAGLYCGIGTQRCPDAACLARTGECTEARDRICNGGFNDGAICASDSGCRGACVANRCVNGCNDGLGCTSSLQCNCDGICNDADPNNPVCVGGARAGQFCDPERADRDCLESFCELFPGCRDPDCCTNVCDYAPGFPLFTEFCCQIEWDSQCAELARDPVLDLCPGLQDANDTCAPTTRTQGAAPVSVPGVTISGANSSRDVAYDPGVCCHQGVRVCSDGCRQGMQCMTDDECPGSADGICNGVSCQGGCRAGQQCQSNADCTGAPVGTCVLPPQPTPGDVVFGTHWYTFTIPPANSPEDPETISVRLDTCDTPNDPDKWDSLIEVFSIADSDRGKCIGLGRCNDLSFCRVADNDCADGSRCLAAPVACSLSADDCPLDTLCEFDLGAACDRTTSMSVIGCNDDAADGCGDPLNRGRLSKLCLSDLERGNTYIVMVGGKREKDIDLSEPGNVVDYRLRLTPVAQCTVGGGGDPVANDYCRAAQPVAFHPTFEIVEDFDLADASWDCEPRFQQCASMLNDVWYEYTPDFSGKATFEACGPDNPSTPNVCLAVYEGCDCPPTVGPALTCGCLNLGNPACELGAKAVVDVTGGQCYKVRLSDDRGVRGAGMLTINFEQGDCNGNDIPDNCEISCGEPDGPCDVPGCGTADDCNGNVIPDACDILISEGGFCDPARRLDCSRDRNMDGRPDECPNCPVGVVEFISPQSGTIAAGYPADPDSCAAAGVDTLVINGPSGAEPICWRLCETDEDGGANFVTGAIEDPPGTYTVTLARPITPGACTTISYTDNDNVTTTGSFTAHPADTNANGVADGDDIAFLLDVLMGVETAPWGTYSSDVDLDGATSFPDLLGVVDLLDGNGACFDPWLGSTPTSCDACPEPQ